MEAAFVAGFSSLTGGVLALVSPFPLEAILDAPLLLSEEGFGASLASPPSAALRYACCRYVSAGITSYYLPQGL